MLKNLSSIALAGAMIFSATGCILVTDDALTTNNDSTTETGDGDGDQTGDGDGDQTGDGDGDQTGDGDGDPATGDGDGDQTGDGDGDQTGDGDGDQTGDGDGDTTGGANMCGWNPQEQYYDCGLEGTAPDNDPPIECPDGLVEGEPCSNTGIGAAGCCDSDGDLWYCGDVEGEQQVVLFSCAEG